MKKIKRIKGSELKNLVEFLQDSKRKYLVDDYDNYNT